MHERAKRRNKVLRHSGILSLVLVLGTFSAAFAQSDEETGRSYAYGNLSVVDGDVWHQRADDFGAHEAERGSPFLPGDRIWTREPGQVELRFAGRVTAWMDQGTKLDYVEGDTPHRLGFWTGSLIVWLGGDADVVVETPGGTFSPQGEGEYRTDLLEDGRTVQFVVYSGIATVSTESGSVLVGSGQRTVAFEGAAPAPPEEYLGNDSFFAWAEERQRRFVTTAETHYDELPEEVREHAPDLEGHGRWHHDVHLGWVWYPTVTAGWAPYRLGRWAHTPFGVTWISYDPWGWAPYHYGRWGHGPLGWYWLPGSVWGPGWVSWSYGYDWVGWSPLGYYGYAVYPFRGWYGNYGWHDNVYSNRPRVRRGQILGKAVPRGSVNRQAWSFTSRDAIGRPASRNRLAASTLRNVENAQVLSGGAVLDRGLRQRAIGETAMTRSAKATARRLSNSRAPTNARRAATGSDRSTSRAQRVAVPRSAARARSARSAYAAERDRATLSRGAAGRDGSTGSPQAGRSRATSRGRATTGPAAAGRRTGRPSATRGGRATTGNRPAAAPRPRATGRSGDSGARRPSSVRPSSPRGGATSAGRSGTSRARPSGASRSRPSGASRSRPSGASRSRPSGASRSRPSAGSRSRPSAGSRSRPSAGSRSRPSGASRSRPSASSRSRPSGFSRFGGGSGASASRGGGSSTSGGGSAVSRGGGGGGGAAASRGGGSSGGSRGSSSGSRRPNNN